MVFIRPVQYKDIPEIRKILQEFILEETSQEDNLLYTINLSRFNFLLNQWSLSFNPLWDNLFIYISNNMVTGLIECFSHPRNKEQFFIKNFVISSSFRNKGHGSFFLKEIIDKFFCPPVKEFSLEVRITNLAVNFYKKNGFIKIASRFYLFLDKKKNIEKEVSPVIRLWKPYRDLPLFNSIMESCDKSNIILGMNLIPYFHRESFTDVLLRKLKNHKLVIYVLEDKAYLVIYTYSSYKMSLLEVVFRSDLPEELVVSLLIFGINKIDAGNRIIFNTTQVKVKNIFESFGGQLYRENDIMIRTMI